MKIELTRLYSKLTEVGRHKLNCIEWTYGTIKIEEVCVVLKARFPPEKWGVRVI